MKSLKNLVREELMKFENTKDKTHIVIIFDKTLANDFSLITEGTWSPSDYKEYWHRVDNPNFDFEQKHVHIAHKRNINTKNKQVSWNEDGTRHDKKSFNKNFTGILKAKEIARQVLNLPDNIVLEKLNDMNKGLLILENLDNLSKDDNTYIFRAKSKKNSEIINS